MDEMKQRRKPVGREKMSSPGVFLGCKWRYNCSAVVSELATLLVAAFRQQ